MGMHGGNWFSFIRYDEEQDRPEVSLGLLRRVIRYARPYWKGLLVIFVTIVSISALKVPEIRSEMRRTTETMRSPSR